MSDWRFQLAKERRILDIKERLLTQLDQFQGMPIQSTTTQAIQSCLANEINQLEIEGRIGDLLVDHVVINVAHISVDGQPDYIQIEVEVGDHWNLWTVG